MTDALRRRADPSLTAQARRERAGAPSPPEATVPEAGLRRGRWGSRAWASIAVCGIGLASGFVPVLCFLLSCAPLGRASHCPLKVSASVSSSC